jgi:hypothetical protein
MTYDVEIDPKSLKKLEALRRAHHNATRQMVFSGDTAATRMVAFVTTELGQRWEQRAPRLTGTLAAATREQVFAEQGRVDIDPSVINPVFGGSPADYGPTVHSRNPWVDAVFSQDAPQILSTAGERFFGEIDDEYRKELG